MKSVIVLAAVAGLASAAVAQNQGVHLTSNGALYRIGGTTAGATLATSATLTTPPTMDLFKPNTTTPDQIFRDWWFYRTTNDTREFAIANATSRVLHGTNGVTYGYNLSGGLSGTLNYTLTGQPSGATSVRMDQTWIITNNGPASVDLNMFHFVDFDIMGAGSDSGTLTTPNQRMRITDATGKGADWWGVGATNYQVNPYNTLLPLLTNTAVNNLANTGLPFGPGDITAGFQWVVHVNPGSSVTILSSYGINTDAVPAPGALALLGLGGLIAGRRRR
ncbi:MAG: hypothetical protein FJ255_05780 [Phycisphaerae bacterium]|nr:hypothetical protein [Phycisphaerae bacterium]